MKLDVITTAFAATLIQLSFVTTSVIKGRGFRPCAPDFRIELELARISRQNHLLHALVNPSILKPAKAGAASFVVIQMFTNSKS